MESFVTKIIEHRCG